MTIIRTTIAIFTVVMAMIARTSIVAMVKINAVVDEQKGSEPRWEGMQMKMMVVLELVMWLGFGRVALMGIGV